MQREPSNHTVSDPTLRSAASILKVTRQLNPQQGKWNQNLLIKAAAIPNESQIVERLTSREENYHKGMKRRMGARTDRKLIRQK